MTATGIEAGTDAVHTARFAPIGLEELVARASLQTRLDRKYALPLHEVDGLIARLDPATRVLDAAGERAFRYESVYFDTPDLASYRSAAQRRRRRFKVRTRSYVDSGGCFLEVKTKGSRSFTVKDRLEYELERREMLTAEGRDYVTEVLTDSGIDLPVAPELQATLTTGYERSTLLLPTSGARVTIDRNLSWATADDRIDLPRLAIVETKSGSTPSEMDRILWASGHRPAVLSKYGVGLAALHPELPANKWNRVLRRYFSIPSANGQQTSSTSAPSFAA